jgi:acylphosphatase
MSHVARFVRVTGLVQGVFFRAWAAEQALDLGVTGWIRNAPDGSVEAHLEGERWAVQQLVDLLHRGPPSARVSNISVEGAEIERAEQFEVRH